MSVERAVEFLNQGISAIKAGETLRARECLQQSLNLNPKDATAWMWAAAVAESGRDSLEYLRQASRIAPDDSTIQDALVDTLYRGGVRAAKAGSLDPARKMLQEAVSKKPDHAHALLWLAGLTVNVKAAEQMLNRVLELDPQNATARTALERIRTSPLETTMESASPTPIPDAPRSATASEVAAVPAPKPNLPRWKCPLCLIAEAPTAPDRCPKCRAVVNLDRIEEAIINTRGDVRLLQEAVTRLLDVVADKADFAPLRDLGLALLNLRRLDEALPQLRAAQRLVPDDETFFRQTAVVEQIRARRVAASRPKAPTTWMDEGKPIALVIDDSATIRKLVSLSLQKNGFRVFEAVDGGEALEVIQTEGVPRVVILDIAMPGMDGHTFCRMIRQNPETAAVPVVMLSGKDGMLAKLRGKMAGSTHYLAKPYQPEHLIKVVLRICNNVETAPATAGR